MDGFSWREATTVNTSVFASYSGRCFLLSLLGGIHVPIGRALLHLLRFIRREETYLPWDEVLLVIWIIITNSTHIWRRRQDLNMGHIGGRRVLSPLRHPLHPMLVVWSCDHVVTGLVVRPKKTQLHNHLIVALGPLKHHFLFQVFKITLRTFVFSYFMIAFVLTFSNYFQMTFQAKYRQ